VSPGTTVTGRCGCDLAPGLSILVGHCGPLSGARPVSRAARAIRRSAFLLAGLSIHTYPDNNVANVDFSISAMKVKLKMSS
jgi:hypothetical protein